MKITMTTTCLCNFICGVLVVAAAGCGTLKIPPYPGGSASVAAQSKEAENLSVTVDPFLDKERVGTYFKQRPLEDGVFILHVQATNANSANSFHVQKQNIRLLLPQGGELGSAGKIDTGTAGGEAAVLIGASLGSVVGMFAGGKVLSDEMFVRKNLVDKEMPDQTLSPGRSMNGFVYYQLPGKKPSVEGATILFTAENASNHEKVEMRFTIQSPTSTK